MSPNFANCLVSEIISQYKSRILRRGLYFEAGKIVLSPLISHAFQEAIGDFTWESSVGFKVP
jgi:hypothetical protein